MVNVLIVGATGYIGQALTSSLVCSGEHTVFGLARTKSKANTLMSQEITPIIGAIDSPSLSDAISEYNIHIVVDVSGANLESRALLNLLIRLGKKRQADRGYLTPKLGFIYTSGTWVHGSSDEPVNDLTPVGTEQSPTPPAKLTTWRPVLEQKILEASNILDTMIIRPALVYGRASTIWSSLFTPLRVAASSDNESAVQVPLDPHARPGLIHVDDVASGLSAGVNMLSQISGTGVYPVFDLVSSQESMSDILESAGRELGNKGGLKLVGPGDDLFMAAMGTSLNGDSGRAKTILGWSPRKIGFVQGMGRFIRAWETGTSLSLDWHGDNLRSGI